MKVSGLPKVNAEKDAPSGGAIWCGRFIDLLSETKKSYSIFACYIILFECLLFWVAYFATPKVDVLLESLLSYEFKHPGGKKSVLYIF